MKLTLLCMCLTLGGIILAASERNSSAVFWAVVALAWMSVSLLGELASLEEK
jgi:hypothetical protein